MTDNLAAGMRFYRDALCRGNLDVVDELAAGLLLHLPSPAADGGVSQLKQIITSIRTAFAGFTMTLEDVIAEGDKLVGRFKLAGTQRAQFMNIPPAGRHFEIEEIMIARLSGGQIAELWTFPDRFSMRQQLGAPQLPPAASRRADLPAGMRPMESADLTTSTAMSG
jgi:predicted ester cyclase